MMYKWALDASSLSSSHTTAHSIGGRCPSGIQKKKGKGGHFYVCVCGRSEYFRHLTESRKVVTRWSYFHECLAHLSLKPSPNGLRLSSGMTSPLSRPSSHVRQVRMWGGTRSAVTSRIARWLHLASQGSKNKSTKPKRLESKSFDRLAKIQSKQNAIWVEYQSGQVK